MYRRLEYLEDRLYAEKLHNEEHDAVKHKKILQELENNASQAYIQWLFAQESGMDSKELNKLKNTYETATAALEEQKKILSTTAKLTSELKTKDEEIKPNRSFTQAEMKLVNEHYKKLPVDLRKLMKVTIRDETISFD